MIKHEIKERQTTVFNIIEIISELNGPSSDILNQNELSELEKAGDALNVRYENVAVKTEQILKTISSIWEEMSKFDKEMTSFRSWLRKATDELKDKETKMTNLALLQSNADEVKEFVNDVMTHGADLKFITISGQRCTQLYKVSAKQLCNMLHLKIHSLILRFFYVPYGI